MFSRIKQEYIRLYGEFIADRKLARPTKVGYYGAASSDAAHDLFRKIKLDDFKSFADLGSGDGKIVLIASLFTKAAGIEIDQELIRTGEKIRDKLKIDKTKACFIEGDYLDIDLSGYDILFVNPDNPMYELEKKLRREMKKEARLIIAGKLYKPLNMKLENEYKVDGMQFGVYQT
ncbi:hypothetical protein GF345_06390 [Candidatus Woesearchaeota archaeon]|nr:hypothetical protein [Candidatus Woesearchaeota archaeon]